MRSFSEMEYHPVSEQLVQILLDKTQSENRLFFRILVAYYLSQIASMMRCTIATPDRGDIPVNMYAINLSPSGTGKGYSTTLIEEEVINQFREYFTNHTFPVLAAQNLPKVAYERAVRNSSDPDNELKKLETDFDDLGPLLFSFDSGTAPALKQARQKILLAQAGSVNLQMDEIGNNLLGNAEILSSFLELYDKGLIKQKLVKNTRENRRAEDIRGSTPTNMMLFGTPSALLNGSKTEDELFSMLEMGYARRSFFGYLRRATRRSGLNPQEVLDLMKQGDTVDFLQQLADHLESLGNIININKRLIMEDETALLMIEYKLKCEELAEHLSEHQELRKAELSHRYFKALKLAGTYAFIDDSPELTKEHMYNAIKLAEESGEAFEQLLTRDRNYVKLAKYLGNTETEVTQADLIEDLPFYRGSASQKTEMMQLAIAHGYKNNIIIKKSFQDGIEFLKGESLKETDLSQCIIAYSTDMTKNYINDRGAFDELHKVTQTEGIHWISHHLKEGYRNEDNAQPGFNLVVIDVDGTCNLSTAKLLLQKYKALYYTTKSHTEAAHRFRIVMPINYELRLDAKDYKEFYSNVLDWLPFEVDPSGAHRCKKWLANNGHYEYTDGELLDVLAFIPKTAKNETRQTTLQNQQQMDNLERWFVNNMEDGNRNRMLHRYAMALVDAGFGFDNIKSRTLDLNAKLEDPLEEAEIVSTILSTVQKALQSK